MKHLLNIKVNLNETKNTLEMRFHHDKKELLEQIENLKVGLKLKQSFIMIG